MVQREVTKRAELAFRTAILALCVVGLCLPFLFERWLHASFEQYAWIISQAGPCQYMGSGAVGAGWTIGGPLLGVLGLFILALTSTGLKPIFKAGLLLGIGLVVPLGLLVLFAPYEVAKLIGC
jgi:hypothetical protein